MILSRAFRAQARSSGGDVVLLAVAAAAFVMALSLATSVPPEFKDAPASARDQFLAPFSTVLGTYGAVLAAIYGSFRYTIDRRNGVVAQRIALQPRWASLVTRVPASAGGGAVIAIATVLGGHLALGVSMGGTAVDWTAAASAVALGAAAGLWGLGVGLIVQQHLLALFVAPMTLGVGTLVAILWADGAVWFPLPALLSAFGFDVTYVGIPAVGVLEGPTAVAVGVLWIALILAGGTVSFLRRDVK